MCNFTNYLYACHHPCNKHPICTKPCPKSKDFSGPRHENKHPTSNSSRKCPDKCTTEVVSRFTCRACDHKHSKDPDSALIFIDDQPFRLSEVEPRGTRPLTMDPWAQSSGRRHGESAGEGSAGASPHGGSGGAARKPKNVVVRNVLSRVKKTLKRDRGSDDDGALAEKEKGIEELRKGSCNLGTKVIKRDG